MGSPEVAEFSKLLENIFRSVNIALVPTEFIELAGKVNQQMPYHCVTRVERMLNDEGRPVKGTRVLLLGVAYKAGIDDVCESPALKILEILRERGAVLRYHDPYVAELPGAGLRSTPLPEALDWADVSVLVTHRPELDLTHVVGHGGLLLDLRGATRKLEGAQAHATARL